MALAALCVACTGAGCVDRRYAVEQNSLVFLEIPAICCSSKCTTQNVVGGRRNNTTTYVQVVLVTICFLFGGSYSFSADEGNNEGPVEAANRTTTSCVDPHADIPKSVNLYVFRQLLDAANENEVHSVGGCSGFARSLQCFCIDSWHSAIHCRWQVGELFTAPQIVRGVSTLTSEMTVLRRTPGNRSRAFSENVLILLIFQQGAIRLGRPRHPAASSWTCR